MKHKNDSKTDHEAQALRDRIAGLELQLQSQQTLIERLQLLAHAVQDSKHSVLITTARVEAPGPQIVYANPKFTEVTGFTLEEVIGKTPRIFQGSNTDRAVLNRLRDDLSRGLEFYGQTLNYRKDGSEFLMHWRISPIHSLAGEITHFVLTECDITDDARWADPIKNLHASNERFLQLVVNIKKVFWITSADGHETVFISPGYETIWGRTCESRYGEPLNWLEAIHAEDRQLVAEAFSTIAVSGTFDTRYRVIRPDGTMSWVHDRGFPIRDEEGNVYRVVGTAEDITAWKQVEEERDRFFNISLDLLCLASMDGYFTTLNPMFEKTLGYTNQELMDKPFLEFVHRDDRKQTVQTLRALAAGHNVVQFENRYLCKDGTYKWLAWSIPAPPAGESVYYAAARDITQQKEVQTALLESEARFRALVRHAPEAILMLDADSARFTDANENALKLYRLSREKLLASTPGQLSPPTQPCGRPSPEMAAEKIGEALKNKTAIFDWMHRDSRGRDIPCEVRLVRLPGRKRLVRASVLDITERKASEEALKQSEARYRELVENANDIIFTIDLAGKFQSLNEAGRELTGYTNEEILKADITLLVTAEDLEKVRRMMRHKIVTDGRTNYEIEIHSKSGHCIPVEIHSRLIYENGEQVAIQGIARDITERRQYEEQLRVAKETAEAANKAKSEFMANMSHEIRTPMNSVIGLTELVLDSQLRSNQREYLSMVLESANSLMSIINDILDFSKIESGKLEILPANFELRENIGKMLKSLALRAHERGLELAWHVAPDVPDNLVGDATRVRQVIVNLVGNAIKFTKKGQILVDVKCDAMTETTAELQFSVADSGIGIPAEKLEVIFDAFEQADTSTTREFGGTGLGLAICRNLVEMMGGKIWAESDKGSSSTFRFTIKFGLSSGTSHEPVRQLSSIAGVPVLIVDDNATNRRGPLRILMAEDGTTNQILGVGLLTAWGHHVTIANNGREAIDQVLSSSFDLVLMDVQMPVMDGLEATRHIREYEKETGLHLPIIAMTAHALPGDREKCLQAGMDEYVSKPVCRQELYAALESLLPKELTFAMSDASSVGQIDWVYALENLEGNRQLLKEVIDSSLEEIPERITAIRSALNDVNYDLIRLESHTIKGSLRLFGETKALAASMQLEANASAKEHERLEGSFAELQREWKSLVPEFTAWVETWASNSE